MKLTLSTDTLSYCASSDSDLNNIISSFTARRKMGSSICNPCTVRMTKKQMLELLNYAFCCSEYKSDESKENVVHKLVNLYTRMDYSDRVKLNFS